MESINRSGSRSGTQSTHWAGTWSGEFESLELRGDFAALLEALEDSLEERADRDPSSLDPRSLAAYARACAFLGQRDRARALLTRLEAFLPTDHTDTNGQPRFLSDPRGPNQLREAAVVGLLTSAQIARAGGEWENAHDFASRALRVANELGNTALSGDAEFALGLSLVGLDRVYQSLDIWQKIGANPRLSSYRRGLATLNEAWILWDLGRTDVLSEIRRNVPAPYQPRLDLCLELKDGKFDLARKWLSEGLPTDVPASEKNKIAPLLVEAIAIQGKPESWDLLKKSWIIDFAKGLSQSQDLTERAWSQRVLTFADEPHDPSEWLELNRDSPLAWHDASVVLKLEALQLARRDPLGARLFWMARINPLIERHRLKSPLLPLLTEQDGKAAMSPHTAWGAALSRLFGLIPGEEPVSRLTVQGTWISWESSHPNASLENPQRVRVNLEKSPVSIRLLEILAGPAGARIPKEYIHRQLTGNRYTPNKHDSRLHKLVGRLRKRLEDHGIPEIWTLPGDNKVVLRHAIEVR